MVPAGEGEEDMDRHNKACGAVVQAAPGGQARLRTDTVCEGSKDHPCNRRSLKRRPVEDMCSCQAQLGDMVAAEHNFFKNHPYNRGSLKRRPV